MDSNGVRVELCTRETVYVLCDCVKMYMKNEKKTGSYASVCLPVCPASVDTIPFDRIIGLT